ncbi:ATP-binding protein [Streptomyces sp. NBC_01571]|uniref:ATP/GTP-binding protein n=1 Tax=Streptomyces sp. NBC_01571 TaxID=2975883 RepID=UPI00225AF1DE|nr:ATP-binding protein [Streptomyces sp. NBC_01571]MCX4573275.1 ATP-binding protein [Streptomyces sp. NBC_01571]
MTDAIRLAVSGTYSTGKSTTTEALSLAVGIPRTHALTARELIQGIAPGKQLEELTASELTALGLRRLEERIHHEAIQTGSYVSDGSVVHEWIYGVGRLKIGVSPGAPAPLRIAKRIVGLPYVAFYRQYMEAYGIVVKARAKKMYDAYVHLPVEFPLKADGHRPVSEEFRALSDRLLIETIEEMGIPYHVVGGSIEERLEKIIGIFEFPLVMPIKDAVEQAKEKVRAATALIEEDAKKAASLRPDTRIQKMKAALRF